MDQSKLNQEAKKGNVEFVEPPQQQPATPPVDDKMNQFLGLLTEIRQPWLSVSAVPKYIPRTFPDQFQFYDDGTNRRLYVYVNKVWRYVTLT